MSSLEIRILWTELIDERSNFKPEREEAGIDDDVYFFMMMSQKYELRVGLGRAIVK